MQKQTATNLTDRITTATCPDCGEKVNLGPQPKKGQKVTCPECWAYLEIISLEPLILSWDSFELEDD